MSDEILVTKWAPLYHFDKLHRIRVWCIEADNRSLITIYHGIYQGKLQTERRVDKVYPKNHEWAQSRWVHKRDREHYSTTFPGNEPDNKPENKPGDEPGTSPRPMLAKIFDPLKSMSKQRIRFPGYVQPKLDGIRCIATRMTPDKITFFSRTGVRLDSCHLDGIRQELREKWCKEEDDECWCLDGELFHPSIGFDELSGMCRSGKASTEPISTTRIQYHIFDAIDKNGDRPFHERLGYIRSKIRSGSLVLQIVPTYEINSVDQILEWHRTFVGEKYEGIIIRNRDGRYHSGYRSWDLQKYKSFQDNEFIIIGFGTGEGREAGAVIWECRTPDGKPFRVRPIGSYKHRCDLFQNASSYVGCPLTVSYQELTEDGIPRFPIGKGIRLL